MQALYLLLGSNKGNRFQYIENAKKHIATSLGKIEQESTFYETAAWGNTQQATFVNQAIMLYTNLPALDILHEIKRIEVLTGRTTHEHWGAREIDIDILLLGNMVYQSEPLQIPHQYLHQRKFALMPLAEIANDVIHPILQQSIAQLLLQCEDDLQVSKTYLV